MPRFPFSDLVKEQAWEAAKKIVGCDPERWRYCAANRPILKALYGYNGLCGYNFDHKIPASVFKDNDPRASSLSNCQILQSRANSRKSNKCMTEDELAGVASDIELNDEQRQLVEMAVHGDINDASGNAKSKCVSRNEALTHKTLRGGLEPCKISNSICPTKEKCEELEHKLVERTRALNDKCEELQRKLAERTRALNELREKMAAYLKG
ncbi:unnamed protein product [Urochloa humidicola]